MAGAARWLGRQVAGTLRQRCALSRLSRRQLDGCMRMRLTITCSPVLSTEEKMSCMSSITASFRSSTSSSGPTCGTIGKGPQHKSAPGPEVGTWCKHPRKGSSYGSTVGHRAARPVTTQSRKAGILLQQTPADHSPHTAACPPPPTPGCGRQSSHPWPPAQAQKRGSNGQRRAVISQGWWWCSSLRIRSTSLVHQLRHGHRSSRLPQHSPAAPCGGCTAPSRESPAGGE